MRSELAEELLNKLMGWDRADFPDRVRHLEALATYKLDEYGNYRPGVKFLESLAAWLDQFNDPADRTTALNFVLDQLIFVSDAEMTHLIELVYPDHIAQILCERVAARLDCSRFAVSSIVNDDAFKSIRRRSLVLGASDGARLDRLRRSAPFLSHEQFLHGTEPQADVVLPMTTKLSEALTRQKINAPPSFEHIFLVDDFAGSGKTLLRYDDKERKHKGKLVKLKTAINTLQEKDLVTDDVEVTIVLYVATTAALDHLNQTLREISRPDWRVRIVQELPASVRVDTRDTAFAGLCKRYYDDKIFTDKHKGSAALGYADGALPVVLSHNTPNNSVCLLWADSTGETGSLNRRALFPRYERHHRDRP